MTRKPISTKTHGLIDYLWAAIVPALSRLMASDIGVKRLLTLSGAGTLIYSLFTRYELGAVKLLPMRVHLVFDLAQGVILLIAALVSGKDKKSKAMLLGLAVIALMVTANTRQVAQKKSRLQRLVQRVQG